MSLLPNPEDLSSAIPTPELLGWLASLTPDTQLTRPEASVALRAKGFDVSPATLASLATRGGGPRYRVFMGTARYRWGDLLRWAESRVEYRGGPARSGRNQARAEANIAPAAASRPTTEPRLPLIDDLTRSEGAARKPNGKHNYRE
jgi:hypothetical protein